jgi:2-polyprenyl-3-methyl-5-hydroxy-6-metoxy-1,4-benzoquinol methylase
VKPTLHTPGCAGHETPFFRTRDWNRQTDNKWFQYLRCDTCGLIRLAKIPENLERYYSSEYYDIPTPERLAELARKDTFKIETLISHSRPGRLLEIGPAWGTFALQAKQAGYQVDAIEMDSDCCEFLNQTIGVRAICSNRPHEVMELLGPHDVITIWQVIEHIPNPWTLLEAVAKNLTPSGILILATPNPDAWQFGVMGSKWPHIDAPRHLCLIPAEVLISYTANLGLNFIQKSTIDRDAKSWNRFGWQRLLMNHVKGKWLRRAAIIAGYGIATFFAPIENREPNGSSYTIVLRKAVQR